MALQNNRNIVLSRDLRNLVRQACTNAPGWHAWAAVHLVGRNAQKISSQEIRNAATDLGVDIEALAQAHGVQVNYFRVGQTAPWSRTTQASGAPQAAPQASPAQPSAQAAAWNDLDDLDDLDDQDDDALDAALVAALTQPQAMPAPAVQPLSGPHLDAQALAAFAALHNAPATPATPATPKGNQTMTDATLAPIAHAWAGKTSDQIVSETLAPIAALFGTGAPLINTLDALVRPLAVQVLAPPQVVEREVIKTVNVGSLAQAGDDQDGTPGAKVCNIVSTTSVRQALGIKAAECGPFRDTLDRPLSIWDGTAADGVPSLDPDHAWDVQAVAFLSLAAHHADAGTKERNLTRALLCGPSGTGKTTTAEQFAARTGRPFVRIPFERTTETQELIGQRMPKAGATEFRQGALVQAMQIPGCVILLDEPSFLRPGVAAILQTILDTGCVYLKECGNRRIDLAPGVLIVAADNTNLAGDETGRHADTMAQNEALSQRFGFMVRVTYLSAAREANVLARKTGIPLDAAKGLVNFASQTRSSAANGQLTYGISLRRLIAWALGMRGGIPSALAFEAAIMTPCDPADRETLRGLGANSADHANLDLLVSGNAQAAPVALDQGQTTTPQGAAAANAFPAI